MNSNAPNASDNHQVSWSLSSRVSVDGSRTPWACSRARLPFSNSKDCIAETRSNALAKFSVRIDAVFWRTCIAR